MKSAGIFLSLILMMGIADSGLFAQAAATITHVTVPMSIESNTPIITLRFKRPDGSLRTARFVFDSGAGGIIVDQGLATDLGLKPEGPVISEEGQFRRVELPEAFVGGMPVNLQTSKAFVYQGAGHFINRVKVEGLLAGKAFEPYQVVLDYPRQLFSVGKAESISHRGKQIAAPYIPSSGHPMLEAAIDGKTYKFLLDTGSNITLMREDMLHEWSKAHPAWPKSTGGAGPANDGGGADVHVFLLRVPDVQLGGFRVAQVVVASRSDGTYSRTSYETPAPIVGALGGNVLRHFRVEIDYPEQLVFLEESGARQADNFDTVGLVLGINPAGQLIVSAVSSTAAALTRKNVLPGDVIVGISGASKVPGTLVGTMQALSGTVGEQKQLQILRNGKPMSVTVVVARIL